MLLLIYSGSITYILVNALIVGLIIGRLARASSRANQVRVNPHPNPNPSPSPNQVQGDRLEDPQGARRRGRRHRQVRRDMGEIWARYGRDIGET